MSVPGSDDPTLPPSQVPTSDAAGDAGAAAGSSAQSRAAQSRGLAIPEVFGQYRIVRLIGEGGMGAVYEAEQARPKRTVALKVIRPGYATERMLRRFELEAEVLGRLLHPGIAQIYEAGVFANPERERRAAVAADEPGRSDSSPATGTPFFAMELVKGVPLTQYAAEKKLGTRERLELVAKICDAVQHAHQKGVIHRDLKPGNILVVESDEATQRRSDEGGGARASGRVGQPKVLDFGVARATDSDIQQTTVQTDVGAIIGTVPYMSPEQVGGDPAELDTRSDVYALGVIAYELLVGRLPYSLERKMIHEAARIIREEEPTRLSSIDRTLRGDIETIVAKALEKEKARRYGAASALAADIRRYLSDEPIAARPASTWYQVAKFSKRNRALVGGVLTSFVLLVAGIAATGAALARESEQRRRAEKGEQDAAEQATQALKQASIAESTTRFLTDLLSAGNPFESRAPNITVREVAETAARKLEREPPGRTEVRAAAHHALAQTFYGLGNHVTALNESRKAYDAARTAWGSDSPEALLALSQQVILEVTCGNHAEARRLAERAVPQYESLGLLESEECVMMTSWLAVALSETDQDERAVELARRAVATLEKSAGITDSTMLVARLNLAAVLRSAGAEVEARSVAEGVVRSFEDTVGANHPWTLFARVQFCDYIREAGRPAEAASSIADLIVRVDANLGSAHPVALFARSTLAHCLLDLHRWSEAEAVAGAVVEACSGGAQSDPKQHAQAMNVLAAARLALGKYAEAEAIARQGLALTEEAFGPGYSVGHYLRNTLGGALMRSGRHAEAEPIFRQCLDHSLERPRQFANDIPKWAGNLAAVLEQQDKFVEAERFARFAIDRAAAFEPPDHSLVLQLQNILANVLQRSGRLDEAREILAELSVMAEAIFPPGSYESGMVLQSFSKCLVRMGQFGEAEPALNEAVRRFEQALGAQHPQTRRAYIASKELYESWHKAEPGKGYDAKAAEWKARLDAPAPPQPSAATPATSPPPEEPATSPEPK